MSADLVWGLLLGTGAAAEVYGLWSREAGDTLSERTRAWFRVRTKPGRAVFTVVWCGFSVWFLLHILTETM
ncbi:hypothetical protein [Streptomyces sp. MJM8645]|uniref:hypothetical protein n=1 Tax=Streptomycetaceae TaxID=2062 RepID=UPI0007AFC5DC|nr:hypothetical protein [Streptomyces sp. MJM8645]